MMMAAPALSMGPLSDSFLGDLGDLARENPDSNQFMHQPAYAALRPLVMMSLALQGTS
jgi:hypothetical protein